LMSLQNDDDDRNRNQCENAAERVAFLFADGWTIAGIAGERECMRVFVCFEGGHGWLVLGVEG
jgi:hypothetical protein